MLLKSQMSRIEVMGVAVLSNLMSEARFVCRLAGAQGTANVSATEFASLDPGSLRPVTSVPAWIGKRSYEGRWWFSRTADHIAFASTWERDVLTFLDYDGGTLHVARDPAIVFPARPSHTSPIRPWLLISTVSNKRVLLLPRAQSRRGSELAAILEGQNLGVAEVTLPDREEMRLIRWLSGYRFSRFELPGDAEHKVREACAAACSVSEVVAAAAGEAPFDAPTVRANLYFQIWQRRISLIDTGAGLSDSSRVVAA